jgi:hypothetical protein
MAKLMFSKYCINAFLEKIRLERTKLDMNEYPGLEISHIKDLKERKEKANRWLKSRINQLEINCKFDFSELTDATNHGYLEFNHYLLAFKKVRNMYKELKSDARTEYYKILEDIR